MNKYICIHGHFYQPPRENPWLNEIPRQDSAKPYHDWNERINRECYLANAQSKILDGKGSVSTIVNNYSKISFNFGPTLLSWMEKYAPQTYSMIREADRLSIQDFGGHGSAIAQCYNHMIMPLANIHDKQTQVRWGVEDFFHRFHRKPEGMWLPETAVDIETLEVLAEHEIKYTILAPHQAKRFRKIGEPVWHSAHKEKVDTQTAYRCNLPSGNSIVLFFYNGQISHEVAFGQVMGDGERFAHRLLNEFSKDAQGKKLVHIATDGETYGHHQRFGNMALAYMLSVIEKENFVKLTNYGQFLELSPPESEVEIRENTSWSCAHGVERWRSDCGCSISQNEAIRQQWRHGLREALDWLRDVSIYIYLSNMEMLCDDPWLARNEFIICILNSHQVAREDFAKKHLRDYSKANEEKFLALLDAQYYAQLMYTSCGWFFDDIGGLEVKQIFQYAAKLIEVMQKTLDVNLEKEFLLILRTAKSNDKDLGNGAKVYQLVVQNAMSGTM